MDRYSLVAIGTILVIALFLTFSPVQETTVDYDYIGEVSDINKSAKGYTFTLKTEDDTMKCFFQDKPNESFYKINGSFSDDGRIFFISSMTEIK